MNGRVWKRDAIAEVWSNARGVYLAAGKHKIEQRTENFVGES